MLHGQLLAAWFGRSGIFGDSRKRKQRETSRHDRSLVKLAAASAPVIHERLEQRLLFSFYFLGYDVASDSLQHVSGASGPIKIKVPKNNLSHAMGDGSSETGIENAIAAKGFTISDGSEELDGVTAMIMPASALSGVVGSQYNYPDDQLVMVVQWSSSSAGSYSSTVSATVWSSPSTPVEVAYSDGVVGIIQTDQQDNNNCNCHDPNPETDPATSDFVDELSNCGCQTGDDGDDDADIDDVQDNSGDDSDCACGDSPDEDSDDPVNFANGVVDESETDLSSDAFGSPSGVTRNWTNNTFSVIQSDASTGSPADSDPTTDVFGNNVVENQLARAVISTGASSNVSIGIATNGNDTFWFNYNGSSYVPTSEMNGSLTVTGTNASSSALISWESDSGYVTNFYGYNSSIPIAQRGQFDSFVKTDGVTTTATYADGTSSVPAGLLTSVSQTYTASGVASSETYAYSYALSTDTSTDPSITINRVTEIQQSITVGSAPATDVQCVQYSYYGADDPNGNFGDLETATIYDGQGPADSNTLNHAPISTDYYRYYIADSTSGYVGGLQFVVTGANYARLAQYAFSESTTVAGLSDSTVSGYANYQYTYDTAHRISSEIVAGTSGTTAGNGNTGNADGFGTYTYTYKQSNNTFGYNSWNMKTVVTQPNGTDEIVYTDFAGEVMLDIMDPNAGGSTSPAATDTSWVTDYQYNADGRVTQISQPSADLVDGTGAAYDDAYADPSTLHISTDSGLIEQFTYGTVTTATTTSAGNVLGYKTSVSYQNGTGSVAQEQESWTYIAHYYSGGATVYAVAADTTYGQTGSGDARTTDFSYGWRSASNAISSVTGTFPLISALQNGPGGTSYDTASIAYDIFGDPVWTQDGDGHVMYTQYDPTTGGIVEQVKDVNFSSSGVSLYSQTYLPSTWTLSIGGLNLVKQMTVDNQGRTTQVISPNLDEIDTVYDDPGHEIRIYDGVLYGTTLVAPAQIYREEWNASEGSSFSSFTEALTYSGPIDLTPNSSPVLGSGYIQTLSRNLLNNAGQVIETDKYFNVSSPAYNASTPQIGDVNVNYYATTFAYDSDGNLNRTVNSDGTIYRTVYDGLNRPISSWVGTSDSTSWTTASPGNLVDLSDTAYDNGDAGDSTVTQVTEDPTPGNSSNDRITSFYYDFRDRQILEIDGAGSLQPIVTVTSYDNADEVTETQQFAGAGYSLGGGNSALLRGQTTTQYNDQGRPYQTSTFSVAQSWASSPGDVGATLTNSFYYDHRGDLMASEDAGGLWTKMAYDGADRLSVKYQTDGAAGTSWTDASGVSADHVFSQIAYIYDGDSDITLTTTAQRFGTDSLASGVDVGPLGNSTTAPEARVSYEADYYDSADRLVADVNAGTFGGSAYTTLGINPVTGGTTTQLNDDAFTGSGSFSGYQLVILSGAGAGERATVTSYNALSRNFSFGSIAVAPNSTSNFVLVDPSSLVTQNTFDNAGWIQDSIDPRNIVTRTHYDMLGRTTQTVTDYTNGTPTDASNQTEDYTYDGDGNLTKKTLVMPSSGINRSTGYVYGVSSSNINDNDMLAAIEPPNPSTGEPDAAAPTAYTYDALGEVITTTAPSGAEVIDAYDQLGRKTSNETVTTDGSGDPTTNYCYTDAGQLGSEQHPNGNFTTYTYDGFGRLASVIASEPDDDSDPLVTSFTYDADGNVVSETDPMGFVTSWTYDSLNRKSSQTDPSPDGGVTAGPETAWAYYVGTDGNGMTETDPVGNITQTTLDSFNRTVEVEVIDPSSTVETSTSFAYDADGNAISVTDGNGNTTDYGFNDLNEKISKTDPSPDGGTTPGGETTWTYDGAGDVASMVGPLGNVSGASDEVALMNTTTYEYDARGQLLYESQPLPSGGDTADQPVTGYTYDLMGNQTSLTDPDGNVTMYVFNQLNETTSMTGPPVAGASPVTTYGYDLNGNQTSEVTPDGNQIDSTFDDDNRLIEKQTCDDTDTLTNDITYGYDADGRMTSAADDNISISYSYDDDGRLTDESTVYTDYSDVTVDESQTFDADGHRLSLNVSVNGISEQETDFTYNALGDWLTESQSYYDIGADVWRNNGEADYSYTSTGQIQSVYRYEGAGDYVAIDHSIYSYDNDDRLTNETTGGGDTFSESFGYDASGQVTSAYTSDDGSRTFSYDGDGRLTAVTPGSGTLYIAESYSYDKAGNRTAETTAVGHDSYIDIATGNRVANDSTGSYAYDLDGNRTSDTASTYSYNYNAFDQLTDVTTGAETSDYTYNPVTGQRMTLLDPGASAEQLFVYDPATGNPLMLLTGTGVMSENDIPGQQLGQTMEANGGWIVSSDVGPVTDLVSQDGVVYAHTVYDAFGNVESWSSAPATRFGYRGMVIDTATGLYYDNARYYDPKQGAFITHDPTGFSAGDYNLYRYAGGSPLDYSDPSGLAVIGLLGYSGASAPSLTATGVGAAPDPDAPIPSSPTIPTGKAAANSGSVLDQDAAPASNGPVSLLPDDGLSNFSGFVPTGDLGDEIIPTMLTPMEQADQAAAETNTAASVAQAYQQEMNRMYLPQACQAIANSQAEQLAQMQQQWEQENAQLTPDDSLAMHLYQICAVASSPETMGNIGNTIKYAAVATAVVSTAVEVGAALFGETAVVSLEGLGATAAEGSAGKAFTLPQTDSALSGTGTLGYTTPQGDVFLQPGLSNEAQAYVLRHESVHAFLTPQGDGAIATFRQNLGQYCYDNSQLLRYTEEATAETYASGSISQGLAHPLVNPYGITPQGLVLEGTVIGGGIFGSAYLGYRLGGGGGDGH